MLMTLVIILLVLWLVGLVTTYSLGGALHVLLVIAVILLLVRIIQGRPAGPSSFSHLSLEIRASACGPLTRQEVSRHRPAAEVCGWTTATGR
jgi:hypothetical protein